MIRAINSEVRRGSMLLFEKRKINLRSKFKHEGEPN